MYYIGFFIQKAVADIYFLHLALGCSLLSFFGCLYLHISLDWLQNYSNSLNSWCIQIVKENQKLHKGSVEIEDDLATLADKSIFPGDVLWVRDSEIYENRDIAGE